MPNLWLDRVTHVSLVDEPAVGDSEFVVMKRAGEDLESAKEARKHVKKEDDSNMETNGLEQLIASVIENNQEAIEAGEVGPAEVAAQVGETVAELDSREEGEPESDPESDPEGESEGPALEDLLSIEEAQAATASIPAAKRHGGSGRGNESVTGGTVRKDIVGTHQAMQAGGAPPSSSSSGQVSKGFSGSGLDIDKPYRADIKKALEDSEESPESAVALIKKRVKEAEGDLPEYVEKQFDALEKSMESEGDRQGHASITDGAGTGKSFETGNPHKKDLLGAVNAIEKQSSESSTPTNVGSPLPGSSKSTRAKIREETDDE